MPGRNGNFNLRDSTDCPTGTAAGYLRVSTEAQAEPDRFGLADQRQAITTFAQGQGFSVVAWYTDEGPGGTLERPGLQRLLTDAGGGGFGVALVAKMDRLARELLAQLWIEKELLRCAVELISTSEPCRGQDPASVLFRQIIGAFAQFEKARIAERMSGGRQQKARLGGYAGGIAALGYRAVRGSRVLHVDPPHVPTVQRVFALRLAHPAWSLQRLADQLNAEGHTTAQGKRFRRMQVKRLLDREGLYRGRYRYAGIEATGQHPPLLDPKDEAPWPS